MHEDDSLRFFHKQYSEMQKGVVDPLFVLEPGESLRGLSRFLGNGLGRCGVVSFQAFLRPIRPPAPSAR